MKRIFTHLLVILPVLLILGVFVSFGTGIGYSEYRSDWQYHRLHPELIASPTLVNIFDMGHSTSYASWQWLSLIQYIGDNVGDNRFLDFSHKILQQITVLHPYFTRPYEIDLILTPLSVGENMSPEQRIKSHIITNKAIELGEKGLTTLCDSTKIEKIKILPISESLWNDTVLRNPCASGMLPYYMGFATYEMGENKAKASEYYKIASMNDDAPQASRILSILALSAEGDYIASAMNFALIGSIGYDPEPYTCKTLVNSLIQDISSKRTVDVSWVNELQKKENTLKDTRMDDNPVSQSSDNCYDMTTRSIKELYLSYIASKAQGTTAKNGDDLLRLGILKTLPTLSTHSGYTVREKNGTWEYQSR